MADEKIRYVLEVDDKGTTKLVKFGQTASVASDKASKGFGKASKSIGEMGQQIPGVGSALSAFSNGPAFAVGAAIGAVGLAMTKVVGQSLAMAQKFDDMSQILGISSERLSVLSVYAREGGVDMDILAKGMAKMGAAIGNNDPKLKAMGITAKTTDEALYQLADRVAGTEDPMLRLKYATDAFGRSGAQMLPMLVKGGAALREMAGSAPIISSELAKAAGDLGDRWDRLGDRVKGVGLGITEWIMPEMDRWLSGVERIFELMGLVGEEQKRAMQRDAIIEKYGKAAQTKRNARTGQEVAGTFQIGGKNLRQALAEFDAANTRKPAPGGDGPALGAVMPGGSGKAATPGSVDYFAASGIDAANVQYRSNAMRQSQFDAAKMASGDTGTGADPASTDFLGQYPDYYAGLPMSDKARESLEAQYDKEMEVATTKAEAQQTAINNAINTIRGDLQGSFSSAFTEIWTDGRDAFDALYDSFSEMFTKRAIESLATLAANFFLPGGGTAGAGILGMLGFASGGAPPAGQAVEVGERRREVFVPQGPGRIAPTGGGGDQITITVSNPAEARSMLRWRRTDERKRNTGIR